MRNTLFNQKEINVALFHYLQFLIYICSNFPHSVNGYLATCTLDIWKGVKNHFHNFMNNYTTPRPLDISILCKSLKLPVQNECRISQTS